jgi:hypothetical protein
MHNIKNDNYVVEYKPPSKKDWEVWRTYPSKEGRDRALRALDRDTWAYQYRPAPVTHA